jgi:hypothetical protein
MGSLLAVRSVRVKDQWNGDWVALA